MNKYLVLLIIIMLFPLLHLAVPGLPVTHDGIDHVARIANFYASLSEGNIVPRWASNLNWGFGHPILMFLYPLPSYSASLFHLFGFSFVDSTKLVFALSYIASGVIMFLWSKDRWGNNAGFIAGLLYTFAPYRFVDLTIRGAIGEHVAFIFLPLTLYALDGIASKKTKSLWLLVLTASIAGLLLSHNAVSLMMIPVAALYTFYLWNYESKRSHKFILLIVIGIVLGSLCASFFWMPAFFEGKYTLRDIVTSGEAVSRMVNPLWFIYSPWVYGGGNEITKQIGMIQWISVLSLPLIVLKSKKRKEKLFGIGLFLAFLITLFIMTESSSFIWQQVTILQKFQFPWRFLTISVLVTSMTGGFIVSFIPEKKQHIAIIFCTAILLGTTFWMWIPKDYKVYDESTFTSVYSGTTDTGESSPIWSVRFMEHKPESPIEVIEGDAIITHVSRNTTSRVYRITATQKTRIVEHTLYFPGWEIIDNGIVIPVEFQDPAWRGRMTFWVQPGDHDIIIRFSETKLRKVANALSLVGIVMSLLIGVYSFRIMKRA